MLLRRWIWLVDIMSVQCLTSKLYIISYLGLLWCKFDGIVYFICALQTLKTSGLATILHFLFSSLSGCVVNRHLILCMLTVFFHNLCYCLRRLCGFYIQCFDTVGGMTEWSYCFNSLQSFPLPWQPLHGDTCTHGKWTLITRIII